nr:glycosyltransferase [Actinomycetota bacterium]
MTSRTVALHAGQLLQPVPGGIGRYVRSLLGALPAAGVEPVAFAAGPAPEDVDGPWIDLGAPRGAVRYELWHRLRRPLVRVPGDVLHATSLAVPPAGGRPLVVTVHDLVFLR